MSQGWAIDSSADTITFYEAPASGSSIAVNEYTSPDGVTSVWAYAAWSVDAGWPGEVEYFSDRMFFAGTKAQPQTLWATKVGDYTNLGVSSPLADDDSLTFTINARKLNTIRDLVALDALLPLTAGGEWRMTAGQNDVVSPSTVGFKPQTYFGASKLPAQIIGNTAIFVQDKGQYVRDIAYDFASDGYKGNDLTAFSDHLVEGHTLQDVAYSKSPYSVVWYVRDDGTLLGLTYMRDQSVVGWHRHDTYGGTFESVCCIPEGDEESTYVIVKRTINGVTKRYVERLSTRIFADVKDAFFVDCGLTYDGRNTGSTTLTLTGGVNWTEDEELTCTASAATFNGTGDAGDELDLSITTQVIGTDGVTRDSVETIRCRISTYTDATHVGVYPIGTVPSSLQGVATSEWTFAHNTISGLDHLEGMTVAVLSDGNVEGQKTVSSGSITLDRPGGVVHVGLPIYAEGESLDINLPGQGEIFDHTKLIRKVAMRVKDSRGMKAGPNSDYLDDLKQREFENYGEPTQLFTGTWEIQTDADWDKNGRFRFVQSDPLPVSVLALIPDVVIGGAS